MAEKEAIKLDAKTEDIEHAIKQLGILVKALEDAKEKSKNFSDTIMGQGKKIMESGPAMKILNDHTNDYADKVKNVVEITKLFIKQQTLSAYAQKFYSFAVSSSTGVMKTFRTALASTGIGIIVIALGALIGNFDKIKKAVLNVVPGLKGFGEAIGGIIDWVTDFIGATSEASRAMDKMASEADESIKRSQEALELNSDIFDEFTKAKYEANIEYQNKVKEINEDADLDEEQRQEKIAKYSDKRNRLINKADADRAAEKQKKREEANQKELAQQQEAADKAKAIADKAAEEAKRKRDEAAAKEEERRKGIADILDDYRKREEDAIKRTNLEKLNLEEQNALAQLSKLKATEDEKAKIQEYYNKQRVIEQQRLSDELKAIEAGRQLALKNLELDQKQWEVDHETDPVVKLEKQRKILKEQSEMELERLQKNKDIAKEDTKEKAEAEAAYALAKQNFDQALRDNELNLEKQKKADQDAQEKRDEELAQKRMDLSFVTSTYLSELTRKNKEEEDTRSDEDKERDRAVAQNRMDVAGNTAKMLADMGGKGAEFAKGIAVSQAIQDTYKGATSAYSSMSGIPVVGPALGVAAAGVAVASGLMNVKKILATKPVEKSAPGAGGGGGAAPPAAPAFNLVQGTGTNQIAESIAGQNTPIQAYVVSSNVTSAQSLDRNIVEQSSL